MNEFDIKAAGWDMNPIHRDRSIAVAEGIRKNINLNVNMTALEFGAGTGITSFLLKDHLKEIVMIDSSSEMVRITNEKIKSSGALNLKSILYDLEKDSWHGAKFDLIMTQMVLHHVSDIDSIFIKFSKMLNPGGYIAIADLYPEDGSFHGEGFTGHKGFDTKELSARLNKAGFNIIAEEKCFVLNKKISEAETRQFDIFLLIGSHS
jgi:2-polyprenyl-3-methyl-5-hydroxy-6-metoxy-1,4-benzoquinol methylase